MNPVPTIARPIYCDGCAQPATPEHLRRRVARLEWASRFRPVHIDTLFLTTAPAAEMEDYFYFSQQQPSDPAAQALQRDLLEACGIVRNDAGGHKAYLQGFQDAGYFLTECVECPIDVSAGGEFDALVSRLMPTLLRRIRFSYRPKGIVLISGRLDALADARDRFGTEFGPLIRGGKAISLPNVADSAGRVRFRTEIAALLGGAG